MAKYRHRTFEMFDFYDEAVSTLKVRPREMQRVSGIETNTLEHLIVTEHEKIVRITFEPVCLDTPPSTCIYRDDFSQLADLLPNDSRVIVDFDGVTEFPTSSLETLEMFYRRLKSKGSRLVLCNLDPNVKSAFYPARIAR